MIAASLSTVWHEQTGHEPIWGIGGVPRCELDGEQWPCAARQSAPALTFVGVAEVAELLGVSKQRVSQLAQQQDFPVPVQILRATPIWHRADVERFAKQARPTGRPRKPPHRGVVA